MPTQSKIDRDFLTMDIPISDAINEDGYKLDKKLKTPTTNDCVRQQEEVEVTDFEISLVQAMVNLYDDDEIAELNDMTKRTIRGYFQRLTKLVNAKDRMQMVVAFFRAGLIH